MEPGKLKSLFIVTRVLGIGGSGMEFLESRLYFLLLRLTTRQHQSRRPAKEYGRLRSSRLSVGAREVMVVLM